MTEECSNDNFDPGNTHHKIKSGCGPESESDCNPWPAGNDLVDEVALIVMPCRLPVGFWWSVRPKG